MQSNVTTLKPAQVVRETATDRARREIVYARKLADFDLLSYENQDAICRALTAALRYLDEAEGKPAPPRAA